MSRPRLTRPLKRRIIASEVLMLRGLAIAGALVLSAAAWGQSVISAHSGVIRVEPAPGGPRGYAGGAGTATGAYKRSGKRGSKVPLAPPSLEARNFDAKSTDPFYRWSARRSEYVAQANVISARTASSSGYGSGFASGGYGSWAFNPWFGMFTFLPASGIYWSPFGSAFYSPAAISYVYIPRGSWSPGRMAASPSAPATSSRDLSPGGLRGGGFHPGNPSGTRGGFAGGAPRGSGGGGFAGGAPRGSGGSGTRGR